MEKGRRSAGRDAPVHIDPEEFRSIGYECVDLVADHLSKVGGKPVTSRRAHPAWER